MRRGLFKPPLLQSLLLLPAALLLPAGIGGPSACAQTAPANPALSAAPNQEGIQITADSLPYRIEWSGAGGTFTRKAFNGEPQTRLPLIFLHSDKGPTGYSKYIAWFLARSDNGFALLWMYLNDSGNEFTCWTYRYPANQLTALKFTGDYHYAPLPEPVTEVPVDKLDLHAPTRYVGPDFGYRQWTSQIGGLDRLDLLTLKKAPNTGTLATPPTPVMPSAINPPVKSLNTLRVVPLHEVEVAGNNGWRADGWRELHALAYDAKEDPYYLILYTNTTRGYALDLKRGQTYAADFGEKVRFAEGTPASTSRAPGGQAAPSFGPKDNPLTIEPDQHILRNARYEITLTSKTKYANPYKDVIVGAEVHTPNGKSLLVPGFWDGGDTWRIRFTPTAVGTWSWQTRSKDLDLRQEGKIECVEGEAPLKGYLVVQPSFQNPRHFAYSDGTPFLPAYLSDPVHYYAAGDTSAKSSSSDLSFAHFQERIDACAAMGFNRFIGGYILAKPDSPAFKQANEGGELFLGGSSDQINPAYFQWMDRRIAYCNAKGIVPDIGLGWLSVEMFAKYSEEQLFRLWYYILSRYSTFDVCWNLVGGDEASPLVTSRSLTTQLNEMTRLYDFYNHPLTFTAPNLPPATGAAVRIPSWLNVITLQSGDVRNLTAYWRDKKPVVLMEQAAIADGKLTPMSPDTARKRMWETRMQGVYWAGGLSPALGGMSELQSPEVRAAAYCADFFRKTRFSRLEPHQEMLGGPEESAADRKRRKKAEAEAAKSMPKPMPTVPPAQPTQAPPPELNGLDPNGLDLNGQDPPDQPPQEKPAVKKPDLPAKAPSSPVFVMADRAWEYVIYFEQGGTVMLDLLEATGRIKVLWLNPRTGEYSPEQRILGGAYTPFNAPDSKDWVLYLTRR